MINKEIMIREELLFPNMKAKNFQEAVANVGNEMYRKGYVRDTYIDAVIEREKKFPTGLSLENYGIAIPHTERQHVKHSVLGIGSLEEPITVYSMTEPEKEIKINLIFLMAVEDPDGQVNMLKKLMTVLQDKSLLQKIESSKNKEEMFEELSKTDL